MFVKKKKILQKGKYPLLYNITSMVGQYFYFTVSEGEFITVVGFWSNSILKSQLILLFLP